MPANPMLPKSTILTVRYISLSTFWLIGRPRSLRYGCAHTDSAACQSVPGQCQAEQPLTVLPPGLKAVTPEGLLQPSPASEQIIDQDPRLASDVRAALQIYDDFYI